MRRNLWKIALSVGLSILLFLIVSMILQLELPAPTGGYAVGEAVFRWVDPARSEVLTEAPNDFREVTALVWYPAVPGTGAKVGYFPELDDVAKELIRSGEVGSWEVFGLRWIRSPNRWEAEPIRDQGLFPVVVFSPGNGTNVEFYSGLASEIASQGYIVVGINHPHDVAAVRLSHGSVAPYDRDQWSLKPAAHQVYSAERIKVRTADVLFVLDQLTMLNENAQSPFVGILDLNSVAAAGHSLGGITASEACKADARFKACLNLDGIQKGGPFSMEESATPPSQPFLFLTKESQLPAKWIESFEATRESYWVILQGAVHESFTDGPALQPSLLPISNQADTFMNLIQQYTLAFLDHTLKDQARGLLVPGDRSDISVKGFPSR